MRLWYAATGQRDWAMNEDERWKGIAIYGLYLIAAFTGLPYFLGVILAYLFRGSASPAMATHFEHQIGLFWRILISGILNGALISIGASLSATVILAVIGLPMVLLGVLGLLYTWVMSMTRSLRGIGKINNAEAFPIPAGWSL